MSAFVRYLEKCIQEDLDQKKMVFIGGPRQVGKTTLALKWMGDLGKRNSGYFNYDIASSRAAWLRGEVPSDQSTWVIDEIHKYKKWKTLIKGLYDQWGDQINIIVTGSTRLDLFKNGGDSLQGRYHYFRAHPLSLPEVDSDFKRESTLKLLKFGGFPEPFFKESEKYWRRWQIDRADRLVKEDIRDVILIRELGALEALVEVLPDRAGQLVSVQSLREDLDVAHETVSRMLDILENFYFIYRLLPLGSSKIKALKKERKLFVWDWSLVKEEGARFENLVGSTLLKFAHYRQDYEGYRTELRYLRDQKGKEIDFVYLEEKKPLFAVEVKLSEENFTPNLFYFGKRVGIPVFYQVHLKKRCVDRKENGVWYRLMNYETFCKAIGAV